MQIEKSRVPSPFPNGTWIFGHCEYPGPLIECFINFSPCPDITKLILSHPVATLFPQFGEKLKEMM